MIKRSRGALKSVVDAEEWVRQYDSKVSSVYNHLQEALTAIENSASRWYFDLLAQSAALHQLGVECRESEERLLSEGIRQLDESMKQLEYQLRKSESEYESEDEIDRKASFKRYEIIVNLFMIWGPIASGLLYLAKWCRLDLLEGIMGGFVVTILAFFVGLAIMWIRDSVMPVRLSPRFNEYHAKKDQITSTLSNLRSEREKMEAILQRQ
ncbi:MAG: hypothetical protein HY318_15510 [Armatimonadetes bacterium]|nr:hypothetical protein [Armatimonadota bacterium]